MKCSQCQADAELGKKRCTACLQYKRDYYTEHIADERAKRKASKDRNKDGVRASNRNRYVRYRDRVIDFYGRKCVCCGETEKVFLSLDHKHGGGRAEKRKVGSGEAFWRFVIRSGFPDRYQILCHNCNLGRQLNGGPCPHQGETKCDEFSLQAAVVLSATI